MLKFLLSEIEKSPNPVFNKKELVTISPEDFMDLTRKKILSYINPPHGVIERIKYPRCPHGCALSVKEYGGEIEAFCLKHKYEGIIPVDNDDLNRYAFTIDNFLKELCLANKLEGKIKRINKNYFYLGYNFYNNQRIDFVFAFSLGDDKTVKLAGLKDIYKRGILVILTPISKIDDITIENRFNKEQVIQSALSDCLNPRTFELHLEKIFDRAVLSEKKTSKIIIKLTEKGGILNPAISGEPVKLVQRLRDSYKLTAILICAKAYNSETPRSLTQLTNNLIRYGFKKGRSIKGRADLPSRVKNLEREVKTLNALFENSGLSSPLVKESGILKWSVGIDDFIRFEDEYGIELKADALRNLLSKYKLFYRYKEPAKKLSRKPKIFSMSGDNIDYAVNPSRQSIQRRTEGMKIRKQKSEEAKALKYFHIQNPKK